MTMKRDVHYSFGTFVFFKQNNGFWCLADNDGTAVFLSDKDLGELLQVLQAEAKPPLKPTQHVNLIPPANPRVPPAGWLRID